MKAINYETVATVLETWESARFTSSKVQTPGLLALDRLFELQPKAKMFFQGGQKQAELHAEAMWSLMDSLLVLMGPDQGYLEEIMVEIGERHRKIGVNSSLFVFMGDAFIYALEEVTGKPLTPVQRAAFEEIYEAISMEIVKNIL